MKIKFITLNLWGGRLFDKALKFLKTEQPDILLIQEIYNSPNLSFEPRLRAVDVLSNTLLLSYYFFVPFLTDEDVSGGVEWGSCIFSRFPIKHKEPIFVYGSYKKANLSILSEDEITKLLRILQHAVVEIDNKECDVYNLHGIWNTHGHDTSERIKMSEIIAKEVKDKQNVILGGDFNVNQGTQTIKNIEKYLSNVFEDKFKTTFNMRYKKTGGYGTAVVDRIFVSRNIKVVEKYQPDVDVSDHLPLVVVIEI